MSDTTSSKKGTGTGMLILTRKPSESIIIGDNKVKIKILSVKGRQIRVGINAERNISIHREEIFNKIKEKESVK